MSEFGCSPDNVSYDTILDVFCKKGRLNEARDLLLDMKNRGLLPNRNKVVEGGGECDGVDDKG
ncbi:pentatricopeptide repeat-containing protein [Quercus suber]|uniref:Pentatricopeptide repeat-containing protein n=1 Tax=Quercus suber TaxID=58331 RepID=A0AAW0JN22_QUESU